METKRGIVTSVKAAHNQIDSLYNIIAERPIQIKSGMPLQLYDYAAMEDGKLKPEHEKAGHAEYGKLIEKLVESADLDKNASAINFSGKAYEDVAKRLLPELLKAARLLVRALVSGAPIVIRYHNDGDGSAGAIAIYRALAALQERFFEDGRGISWEMNRRIAYTLESFYSDKMLFGSYESIEKPVVVITDFGTSPESVDAIKASEGVCDLIWLDHHPIYEGFPKETIKHYVNVYDFGGDTNFSAGLLSAIFARVLCDVEVVDVGEAALVSDYSSYADMGNAKAVQDAMILDYLTSSGNGASSKPKYMDAILKDSEKSESTFRYANSLLTEALDTGMKNLTKYRNADGVNIYVLDFSHIARSSLGYPLPGRYSSKLQYRLESINNGKTMTVVHYGSYISLRVSSDINGSVKLLEIIERLKDASGGTISGGGHMQAASIKTDREHMDDTVRMLLSELGIDTGD